MLPFRKSAGATSMPQSAYATNRVAPRKIARRVCIIENEKNLRQGTAGGFGGLALRWSESSRRPNMPAMLGQLANIGTLENYLSKSCLFAGLL
jgi:hypothetical protein